MDLLVTLKMLIELPSSPLYVHTAMYVHSSRFDAFVSTTLDFAFKKPSRKIRPCFWSSSNLGCSEGVGFRDMVSQDVC